VSEKPPISSTPHWWNSPRKWLRTIILQDDTPHHIALGTAIGMFIAMTPTVGIQMGIVGVLALLTHRWFHFNRVAALMAVYISNPLTVLPIYWFSFKVGTYWFPSEVTRSQFSALLKYEGIAQWWESLTGLFVDIGPPLIVGSLVVATLSALPTYPVILYLVTHLKVAPEQKHVGPEAALAAMEQEKRETPPLDQQNQSPTDTLRQQTKGVDRMTG